MAGRDFLNPKNLSPFKRFELLAHSVMEGFISGSHKSPYKGLAIEFAEHRQYVPGDDIKHLDWKVLGKLDRYYIKQYEEDTSLRAYILLDTSGSMGYRTGDCSKLDYGKFICSVLAFILTQQSDSTALITFDSDIVERLPLRSTLKHLKVINDLLRASTPGSETGMGKVLHSLATMLKRRALVVIISDFFDDIDEITRALNHFAHKKHEVVVFQVLDRKEAEFPFRDLTKFTSLENEDVVLTDPVRLKKWICRL
jgi:uncharacterized protein (DUF58 family)